MTLVGTLKNIGYIALFILLVPLIPLIIGGITKLYDRYIEPRAQVGVLPIKGVLYDSSYYTKQLNRFFKDDQIKAILLKIECAGSAAGTGQALYHELLELKKTYPKPVIVLIENICASGGYYIASAADHIIASPMAMIGSIGVAMPYFFQCKDLVEYYKIKYVPLAAGDYKNSTNPFTDITPEQKQMLQSVIDDSYEQFAQDIAASRHVSLDTKNEWANGRIFNGRQAIKLGLIDELGSASQAIKALKERAGITTDIKWVHAPSRTSFWSMFGGESDDEQTIASSCINEFLTIVENRYNNHTVS
jgi:protease IV